MKMDKRFLPRMLVVLLAFACMSGNPETAATSPTYSILHKFSPDSDGAQPFGSLTPLGQTLLGMCNRGGANNRGTIFSVNNDGTQLNVLHHFAGGANDGEYPFYDALVLSGKALYGMTNSGGSVLANSYGVIFKINIDGSEYQILHNFGSVANDGIAPRGALTLLNGVLYGMTFQDISQFGKGAIFRMNPDGSEYEILHNFAGGTSDGAYPYGSLAVATTNLGAILYGMTASGGANGVGTIFKINPDGTGFQLVHSFNAATEGSGPYGSLLVTHSPMVNNNDLTLYGMAAGGGPGGWGTIFSMTIGGSNFQVLQSFNYNNGGNPYGSLTLSGTAAVPGTTLYGMTNIGGSRAEGVIFQINLDGSGYQNLYTLSNNNGINPWGSLYYNNSVLYGLTSNTGSSGYGGVLFSLALNTVSPPVASFTPSTTSGTAPLVVNFTDASTGSPTGWSWTFGDGGTSNVQNPSHTYTSAGTNTVTLTASNSGGSTSAGATITVRAGNVSPVAATLVSPSGAITTGTPAYTWNAVSNATWYYLWVNDSTGNRIVQWYKAADAGCSSGTGTCTVTPTIGLADGAAQWWIQTYNSYGYGPWSSAMAFTVSKSDHVPPVAAVLVSPTGMITTGAPTFLWNAVSNSTWYFLWVNDSTGTRIQQWYTAAQANCASGAATCSVAPTTVLANGGAQWWVQTYNSYGYGPWSSGMSFTVTNSGYGLPIAATLVSPYGMITASTPTYTWNAVSNATWYYLWVNDSTGNVIQQWYSAAEVGCAAGTGTCSITPTTVLAKGTGEWWVQTWNSYGFGPWSSGMAFSR